ncbi:MAG TPA: hypothetical protein VFA04_19790 [Bryobacteraceae bacterium]|nr:hypothetical protein [Bryobacteraceae bacterium]
MLRLLPGLLLVLSATAQPLIYYRDAVNAASFMPQGLPGGGIAQGSIFAVFGSGLGPAQGLQQTKFPLSLTLGGASLTVTQGSATVNPIPVFVGSGQINAIMPSNAPLGAASLQVTVNGQQSNPLPIIIVNNAFGIFTANGSGMGSGVLQNFVTPSNQPVNAPTISAYPGQTLTLWGTGLGPVSYGDNIQPTVGNLPTEVEVFVGAQAVSRITYHGRAPCCAGADQIDFVIPNDAPLGCWVPVYVRTGGATVSNVVSIAIQNKGANTCSDAGNAFSAATVSGGKVGGFTAVRAITYEDVGVTAPVNVETEFQASAFYSLPATLFPFNPATSLPPAGTCTAYTRPGDMLNGDLPPGVAPSGTALNAGTITLTGPNGNQASSVPIPAGLPQFALGYFGGSIAGTTISGTLDLDPGTYKVTGSGGSDVGAFSTTLTAPAPIIWTGQNALLNVPRSQPLTISWSGGSSTDRVGILGFGEDLPSNSSTAFLCVAPEGATSFTIPAAILANVPATRANPLQSKDVIYLLSVPGSATATISASGLNAGSAKFTYVLGKTVIFQ